MRKLFLLFFLITPLLSQAQYDPQDIELGFGPLFSVSKRSVPTQFVGTDNTGFYVVYSRGKLGLGQKKLHKFGFDLKPQLDNELSRPIGGVRTQTEVVLLLKNKLYQISHGTSNVRRTFYVQSIDKETLKVGPEQQVGSFTTEGKSASKSQTFITTTSDSSYVGLIYTIPNRRKENERFAVHIFDAEMQEVWSQEYDFPYENRLFDLQEFQIDRRGDLYMLAKRFFNVKREQVEGAANYDYLLFNLKQQGGIDSLRIQSQGKFLRDMRVTFTPDGDIVSAGFYSDRSVDGAGGAYYMRLDGQSKEVKSSSFKPFEVDFLTQNMTERKAKRVQKRKAKGRNVELPFYYIDELISMPDGSIRMIGERRHVYTSIINSGGGVTTTITHYDYDDLVVVSISPAGEVDWANRIAKMQHTVDDNAAYSSYATMQRNNELVLFFNDNAENLLYDGVGRVAPMRKNSSTVVMAAKVGQFGDVKRSGLFRRGEASIKIRPVFSHQLDNDEMLIFGHRQVRNQRFVILKFK